LTIIVSTFRRPLTAPAAPPIYIMAVPTFVLPKAYRLFFLFIEPISALVGAYYAHFQPLSYLQLSHLPSAPANTETIPLSTTIVLSQLANLYFLFALNEALVLRSTSDLRVWRTVLFGLLIADLGHLWSVKGLGGRIYYDVLRWNKIDWGNVGFVYMGATMRIAFLSGIGLKTASKNSAMAEEVKKGV
jgi:hypothetical protein